MIFGDRMAKNAKKNEKEPVFIIRPAIKNYGLDYLHISLIVLVIILVGLALALSTFKQGTVLQNCSYGIVNGTCATLKYNSTQALASAERILASYAQINTTLALLPYYSLVNQSSVSYLQNQSEWLVIMPYIDPLAGNEISNMTMVLSGNDLSLKSSSLETIKPPKGGNNSVSGLGAVDLYGKALCTLTKPVPVYLITDPYAPGAISSLYTAVNAGKQFSGSVNISYDFIFSDYAVRFYNGSGVERTQALGRYLMCASRQPERLVPFLSNLSIVYLGSPVSNYTLTQVEDGSGMNLSRFNACLGNATTSLNNQASLARLYGVTSTPEFIVDCKYASIPQTVDYAIDYTLKSLS